MSYSDDFIQQSKLMLQILQLVGEQNNFALKGGTAINYFYSDMPRVSVDIDLVFLPLLPRDQTIIVLNEGLMDIANSLKKSNLNVALEKPIKVD